MYQTNLFSQDLSSVDCPLPPPRRRQSNFWDDVVSGKIANQIKDASYQQTLSSSQAVYNTMKPVFAQEDDVERMYGIYATRKNQIISMDLIARGSIAGASVYPREIVKAILAKKACALILSHNHPSGDPTPSMEDIAITKHVLIALHCISATLLDHVIVGADGRQYSFADTGTLGKMRESIEGIFKHAS